MRLRYSFMGAYGPPNPLEAFKLLRQPNFGSISIWESLVSAGMEKPILNWMDDETLIFNR